MLAFASMMYNSTENCLESYMSVHTRTLFTNILSLKGHKLQSLAIKSCRKWWLVENQEKDKNQFLSHRLFR